MTMNTPQNKRILWDILKDNNVFENMKNTQYKEVKDTFDSVVEVTSKNLDRSNFSIVEKNKVIIENLIPAIEKISHRDYYQQSRSNTTSNQYSRPTMQVVYDSDNKNMNTLPLRNHSPSAQSTYFGSETQNQNQRFNLKKSEQSDYNIDQFNKQKMERELTLDPKKPDVIDFSDKSIECDSPIGEDMDRLIAERLAARERELSLVPPPFPPNNNTSIDSKNGSSLQNNSYENVGNDNYSHGEERKVTFSKEIEQINSNIHTDHNDSGGGISSKLKLKRSVSPNKQIQGNGGHSDDRLILDADTGDNNYNYVSQEKFEALLRRVEHLESIVNKL
jgi:hypothetical protein